MGGISCLTDVLRLCGTDVDTGTGTMAHTDVSSTPLKIKALLIV